ncbi:MAG: transglutaminase domain-containing protein [Armatimonadota bacterium]
MRNRVAFVVCLTVMAIFLSVCHAQEYTPIASKSAWEIADFGNVRYVADRDRSRILRLEDGVVVGSISTDRGDRASRPRGLCAAGDVLACIEGAANEIIFVDPQERDVVRSISAPGPAPRGLAFDEEREVLWCNDLNERRVYALDPATGEVKVHIPVPSNSAVGMDYARDRLWIVDSWDDCVYRVDPQTAEVEASVAVPPGEPRGVIARDGELVLSYLDSNSIVTVPYEEGPGYTLSLPTEAHVKLVCEVTCRTEDPAPAGAEVRAAIPVDSVRQSISNLDFFPEGTDNYKDPYGQKVAAWDVPALEPGETFTCGWEARVSLYAMRLSWLPGYNHGSDDAPGPAYLRDGREITTSDPGVRALAKGLETFDPLQQLLSLRNRVFERMEYVGDGRWDPADVSLERGTGSCSEYSFIFAGAARNLGIPVRLAGGSYLYPAKDAQGSSRQRQDDIGHRWVEVFMDDYGWLPVDAQREDRAKGPPFSKSNFLAISNRALVCCRSPLGEDTAMGMNYKVRFVRPAGPNLWDYKYKYIWTVDELKPWTK